MNLSNIGGALSRAGTAALRTLEHHAPKILMAIGIGCGIGGAVTACKATLKLPETMQEINNAVDSAKAMPEEDEGQKKIKDKEVVKSYISGGVKLAKLYAPSIGLGVTSVVCVLGGNHIMNQRYSGAVAAVSATERMFANYRSRVVEELGADKDFQFANGIREVTEEEPVLNKDGTPKTDKNGEVKTTKKTHMEFDQDMNKYSRIFEECTTHHWDPDPDYNRSDLILKQNHFNQMLHSKRYVFLNDVYEALGFPITSYGQDMGWIIDSETPDACVDFGLYDFNENGVRRIDDMDYNTNAILLTFKGVRYIKDKVYRVQRIF